MKHCLAACIAVAALSMISTPAAAQTVRLAATLSGGEEAPAPGVATARRAQRPSLSTCPTRK